MNQEWFEMGDIRRRKLDGSVWIPLRASQTIESAGKRGHLGYRSEFFGAGSIAVLLKERAGADALRWHDLGLYHTHRGSIQGRQYVPADVFRAREPALNAVALVLAQDGNSDEHSEWHLHQDFVITLRLKREADTWLAMDEGYIEIARLRRDDGNPVLLEVRAEHLKDYLCARRMALYVSSYRSRDEVIDDELQISWTENPVRQLSGRDRWEGRKFEIHEGGQPYGSSMKVMHIGRKGVDYLRDVPTIGFSDEVASSSWTVHHKGQKLIHIQGELWRNECVEPAQHSPRVRGDKLPSSVFFITDATGIRCNADSLEATGGWLWFGPEVMVQLSHRRGGSLQWYTRDTGGVRCSPSTSHVSFGVNRLGLVNVFAKDIGNLDPWMQIIWSGFNVSPEGGVSEELLAAQAEGNPADTQAPESYLPKVFDLLNELTIRKFGFRLFRPHDRFQALIKEIHRFRSTDKANFFSLAKDLARLTADAIDAAAIQKIVKPPKEEKWGSLKSLEKLVALKHGPAKARSLLGPLFGIYEMRHADAHLPKSDTESQLELARVDKMATPVIQGYQLLHSCVSSLYSIAKALEQ
jgi:hypothetical protein